MPEPTLYLFDGYNLLHAGTFGDRDELVDTLASFVAGRGARGVVAADACNKRRVVLRSRSGRRPLLDGGPHPWTRRDAAGLASRDDVDASTGSATWTRANRGLVAGGGATA